MASKKQIPNYGAQADIQRKQREATQARRTGNRVEAARQTANAQKATKQAETVQRANVKRSVSGPIGASAVEQARKSRQQSVDISALEKKLADAKARGASMLASQIRKQIAAARRAQSGS